MNHLFDLSGKTAVVTGGSRGIGKEIAKGLASAGADIVVIARSIPDECIEEIKKEGTRVIGISYDLTNIDGYEQLVEDIISKMGSIDILINNAGVQKRHSATQFPKEDWNFVLDVNLNSVFFLCQSVGKKMLEQGEGKIINIASLLSFQGGYTVPAYAASKGAVMQLTKSLANEWASKGVNVNAIAPGYMSTDMNEALIEDPIRSKQILDRIPAGRWGSANDMQGTAIFLASKASSYLNGFTIAVDGGWLGR